jgi:hypothetical protein
MRISFLFVVIYPDTMIWIPYLTGVNWCLTALDCAHRRLDVPIRILIAEPPRVARRLCLHVTFADPIFTLSANVSNAEFLRTKFAYV